MEAAGLNFSKCVQSLPIVLFFQDEGRFGRINNIKRCWVQAHDRAIVGQQLIREYIYAFTAVCPGTGENFSLILPWADTDAMNMFLSEFSKEYSHYRVIMVMDKAGWHRSYGLNIPNNISLLFLPPYSPELNPVEKIWRYIREKKGFNNHTFSSIDDVENNLEKALYELYDEKEEMKSLCNFKWLHSITC
jgi:hypothetical protein